MSDQNIQSENKIIKDPNVQEEFIPDEILNYDATKFKKTNKKDGSYKKAAAKSGFLITLNPNISHKKLDTPEKRKELFLKLKRLSGDLEREFRAGRLLVPKPNVPYVNNKPPTVESYKLNVEIGKQIGFMHGQGYCIFNGTTYINLEAVRKFIKDSPNGFSDRNIKVQFKWFAAHNEDTLKKYIDKDYEGTRTNTQEQEQQPQQTQQEPTHTQANTQAQQQTQPQQTNTQAQQQEPAAGHILPPLKIRRVQLFK
jgi:hypothetical protein